MHPLERKLFSRMSGCLPHTAHRPRLGHMPMTGEKGMQRSRVRETNSGQVLQPKKASGRRKMK